MQTAKEIVILLVTVFSVGGLGVLGSIGVTKAIRMLNRPIATKIHHERLGPECAKLKETCKNHPYGELSVAAEYCTIFSIFRTNSEYKCEEMNTEIAKYR